MRDSSFYDEIYFDGQGKSNYGGYTLQSSPFARHAESVAGHMRAFGLVGPVLDVGCAKGYLVCVLRKRGIDAFGVDWSKYALATASPDVRRYLWLASAVQLPFASQAFSLTVTYDVLEHMDKPNARSALQECARVSQRQLHQVNTGRLPEWGYEHDDSHALQLSLSQWRVMVAELGLAGTTVCEPNPVPLASSMPM